MPRVKPVRKNDEKIDIPIKIVNVRRSLDLEKSEDNSLYVSALEDVGDESIKRSRLSNIQVHEF